MIELCVIVAVAAVLGLAFIGLIASIRFVSGAGAVPQPQPAWEVPARCRRCGRLRHVDGCRHCDMSARDVNEWAAWKTTADHLVEYRDTGLIDETTFARLRKHALRRCTDLIKEPEPKPVAAPKSSEAILEVIPVTAITPEPRVDKPQPGAKAVAEAPAEPRRGWFAAFMEERHILWGELVGGLLVVGCSVALVLSLWQTLQQIVLFPFLILAALTSVLFAVGRYTLRKWKLESTSRGLLVIALLMVPLSFLVLAKVATHADEVVISGLIKCAAVPWFGWLIYRAARDLFPNESRGLLTLGVLGTSVGSFLLPMLVADVSDSAVMLALPLLPVVCHAAAIGLEMRRRSRAEPLDVPASWRLLGYTGLVTFPLVLALGFTLVACAGQGGELRPILIRIGPLVALTASAVSAAGLFVMQRSRDDARWAMIAGSGFAVLGLLAQAIALIFVWPHATFVFLIGIVIFAVWSGAAVAFRMPPAHAWAISGLVVAALAAPQLAAGNTLFQWRALIAADNGVILAGLGFAFVVAADRMRSANVWHHGVTYAGAAALLMTAALVLVGREAAGMPARAAAVSALAATLAFVLASRWNYPLLRHVAFGLVPLVTLAALHWLLPGRADIWEVLLAAEVLAFSLTLEVWGAPIIFTTILAAGCVIGSGDIQSLAHPLAATLVAAATIVQAQRRRLAPLALAASALLLAAVMSLWLLRPSNPPAFATALALLTHAVMMLPALAIKRHPHFRAVGLVLDYSGKLTSVLAAIGIAFLPLPQHWDAAALCAAGVTTLWLIHAFAERQSAWLSAAQAASAAAATLGVIGALAPVSSFVQALDRHFEPIALALTGVVAGWTMIRLALGRSSWAGKPEFGIDRIVLAVLLPSAVVLAAMRTLPSVLQEIAAGWSGEFTGQVAYRVGGVPPEWLLVTALASALTLNFPVVRHAVSRAAIMAGLLLLAMTVAVIAAREFAVQHAAASALRWGLAAVYLGGSALLWPRRPRRIINSAELVGVLRDGLLPIAALIPLLLTLVTMARLIAGESIVLPAEDAIFRRLGFTWSHAIPLALIAVGCVGHAIRERNPIYAFLGGLLTAFLVGGGFLVGVATVRRPFDVLVTIELVQRVTIALAVWSLGWLFVARHLGRLQPARAWSDIPSRLWHVNTIVAATTLLTLVVPAVIAAAGGVAANWLPAIGAWQSWAGLALLVAVYSTWSRFTRARIAVHLAGVGALVAAVLAACLIPPADTDWSFRVLLGGWVAIGVAMVSVRDRALPWFTAVGALLASFICAGLLDHPAAHPESAPFLASYLLLAAFVLRREPDLSAAVERSVVFAILVAALGVYQSMAPTFGERLVAPLSFALLTATAVVLAREQLLRVVMSLIVLSGVALAWAFVDPAESAPWLHRGAMVVLVLTTAALAYGFGPWGRHGTVRQMGLALGKLTIAVLVGLIIGEGFLFDRATKQTPLSGLETGLVMLAIVGLLAGTLAAAIEPREHSFGLTWGSRRRAVYLAEGLLVLLFLHLRFNVPGLFPKIEAQTWAFLIMAIAFVGVGLGELFRRLRLEVLVDPLRRTGLFLPLLPLLMFWMKPAPALREWLTGIIPGTQPLLAFFDQIPTDFGNYALLWLLFGGLFALLAIVERSYWFTLASALAANAGLWSLLHGQGVSFLIHPQAWLVPLALIVLASEWYHRARLRLEESAALRYTGLGMLYLSSTADMFLAGLGNSAVLPLVLAVLSVAGVLTGIMLRVRAYLFLGTGFLAVVVLSMIWHAAVDLSHTWLWWTCGVALGAAILTLFGLFEKRRLNIVQIVDELRTWQ